MTLQSPQSEGEIIDENIKKYIISAIEMNDLRPQGTEEDGFCPMDAQVQIVIQCFALFESNNLEDSLVGVKSMRTLPIVVLPASIRS